LHVQLEEGENVALIDKLQREARFPQAQRIVTIDGVRAEYVDGFGLARSSNTTPVVVLRFEGESEEALQRIQEEFRSVILAAKADAKLPF
jgi:phosphomannomutase / phosphoglucomutase